MDNIKNIINESIKDKELFVDEIKYDEKQKKLEIVLDSDTKVVDLNTVVDATHIISPLLDEYDFIKESYTLDISSKEKGGSEE